MFFCGFFLKKISRSPSPWHIHDETFGDLHFAPSFKLLGALHGGSTKIRTKVAPLVFSTILRDEWKFSPIFEKIGGKISKYADHIIGKV